MSFCKNVKTIIQICLPCFFHQPYSFHFSLIPRLQGRFLPVAYEKSHNRFRVSELMQLETFSIVLCDVQIGKDVVIQPLYQGDTLEWSKKIFRYDIAELVIRDILNIIGCKVGNLSLCCRIDVIRCNSRILNVLQMVLYFPLSGLLCG